MRVAPAINQVAPPVRGERARLKTSKLVTIDVVREIHPLSGGWIVSLMGYESNIIVKPAHSSSRAYAWREWTEK